MAPQRKLFYEGKCYFNYYLQQITMKSKVNKKPSELNVDNENKKQVKKEYDLIILVGNVSTQASSEM
jgi:hypothetical protein